jgi:hypothetical protein
MLDSLPAGAGASSISLSRVTRKRIRSDIFCPACAHLSWDLSFVLAGNTKRIASSFTAAVAMVSPWLYLGKDYPF